MSSNFPGADDVFTEPSSPGSTALSSAGTGSRNHTQHHRDLGDAIEAMQAEATLLVHSHNGSTARHGSKLSQANTHQSPDTDSATSALHHTIGTGANQAAAGNHTHTQSTSHGSPDTDSATSALHHTIGTGANQAAAGNHTHGKNITLFFTNSGSFIKADYAGVYALEVEVIGGGGGGGGVASTDASHYALGYAGAGGGYSKGLVLAASLAASVTVTVGNGGAGGVNGQGSTGGTSSFGAHFTAAGGQGGGRVNNLTFGSVGSSNWTVFGGAGGGSEGNKITVPGGDTGWVSWNGGGAAPVLTDNEGMMGSPSGGPYGQKSRLDYGIGQLLGGSLFGNPGKGYGGGASGLVLWNNGGQRDGSAGAPGLVIVRVIF